MLEPLMNKMYHQALFVGVLCWFYAELTNARLMFEELDEFTSRSHHYSKLMDHQNIVMVGDSLMRYQYVSLIYLIHTNTFFPETTVPSLLWQEDYGDWGRYFKETNAAFYPNEYCDCYRVDHAHSNENRYYYHKERNISISYIQYRGDNDEFKIHGHWSPRDNVTNHQFHAPDTSFIPYDWEADSIQEALFDHVAKLKPKPTVLVLNAGMWANKYDDVLHRNSVLNLAVSLFDRVIWKTTNYISGHKEMPSHGICEHPGIECLNLNWTKYLNDEYFRDHGSHFQPVIYNDINVQLILQLTHKHKTLAFVPLSVDFYGKVVVHKNKRYLVDQEGILRPFMPPSEETAHMDCMEKLNNRTHVTLPALTLRTHIVGAKIPIPDICAMLL